MQKEVISRELLEILVCPQCHAALQVVEHKPEEFGLKCALCHRIYPIREGIPVMLIEEAISPK